MPLALYLCLTIYKIYTILWYIFENVYSFMWGKQNCTHKNVASENIFISLRIYMGVGYGWLQFKHFELTVFSIHLETENLKY